MTLTGGPNIVWESASRMIVHRAARSAAFELLAGRFSRDAFTPGDGTQYTPTIVPISTPIERGHFLVVLDDDKVFTWDGDQLGEWEIHDRTRVREWDAVVYAEFLSEIARVMEEKPTETRVFPSGTGYTARDSMPGVIGE